MPIVNVIFQLFFFNWTRSNLILKPFVLDEIMTVLQDWTRYFLLIYFAAYRPALLVQLLMGIVLFQYALIMVMSSNRENSKSFLTLF